MTTDDGFGRMRLSRQRPPAWLAMGFRPFFLLGAIFACGATGVWLHALAIGGDPARGYLPLITWHAHEMLFGFALAIVAGFLLTAARSWTGLETLQGFPLLALVCVWALGRLSTTAIPGLPRLPGPWVAALAVAFPATLTFFVGRAIVVAHSRRNLGIVAVLLALTVAELLVQMEALGILRGAARPAIYAALHLIVTLNVVIGGRVIPLFTANRTGVTLAAAPSALSVACILAAVLVAVLAVAAHLTAAEAVTWSLGSVAGLAGVLQLWRMRYWAPGAALRIPELAVLHAGYAWIGAGYLLLAASCLSQTISPTVAVHALTIGVVGTMTVGMMTRVTLGHTGRPIRFGKAWVTAVFAINLSAVVRLSAALVNSSDLRLTWLVSGGLFIAAYALYLWGAVTPLSSPRPDGKPG